MRRVLWVLLALATAAPGAVFAQTGTIAGEVRDTSGGIVPGVTVEATSPALIEKSRAVTTDAQGRYAIVDLRPGLYTVTYTLTGFSTIKRDAIVVTTDFTATVNAQMSVGSIEQMIVVSGAAPVVDTRNTASVQHFSKETLQAIPTAKTLFSYAAMTPGAVMAGGTQDVGGNRGEQHTQMGIHGGPSGDQRLLFDGIRHTVIAGSGQAKAWQTNQNAVQEVVMDTGGQGADSDVGGIVINVIPRDGGNQFSGVGAGAFTNDKLQGDNLDDTLRQRGASTLSPIRRIWDIGGGVGGPIRQNRLWFWVAARDWGAQQYVANAFWNATPGTLVFTPDRSRPGYIDVYNRDVSERLTWQIASKHKLTLYNSNQANCLCGLSMNANRAPEASLNELYTDNGFTQVRWTSPITNRFLVQAGAGHMHNWTVRDNQLTKERLGAENPIPVTELSTGFIFNAPPVRGGRDYADGHTPVFQSTVSASYVTGSNTLKAGLDYTWGGDSRRGEKYSSFPSVTYSLLRGVPSSVVFWATPVATEVRTRSTSVYVQDQWQVQRFSISSGVRFDALHGWDPAQSKPAGPFVGAIDFPEITDIPNWKSVSPRVGVAYDVFGTGRTAVKGRVGYYPIASGTTIPLALAGTNVIANSTTRTWNDANGDFIPQTTELGPSSNPAFGTPVITVRYDPEAVTGHRPATWQYAAEVQHEIVPGTGATIGYYRTSFRNFTVVDNTNIGPADYDPFCITGPVDSRLPGGGGQQLCGLFNLKPSAFARGVSNITTRATNFGDVTQVYDGLDATVYSRFGDGGQFMIGFNTGRTVTDNCFVVDSPQQSRFCHVTLPWGGQTQLKARVNYPLPWQFQFAAVYQDLSGPPILANFSAPNALAVPGLGRNLAACGAAIVCNAVFTGYPLFADAFANPGGVLPLYEPNTNGYEERLRQLDLRASRLFTISTSSLRVFFDLYNVFNANSVLSRNNTYGPAWGRPLDVLGPRLAKLGFEWNF